MIAALFLCTRLWGGAEYESGLDRNNAARDCGGCCRMREKAREHRSLLHQRHTAAYTCVQIGQEMARVESALTAASAQQNKARTNDTVGVIFLGLPVSSLSGDNIAAEIARLKGEKDALHRAGVLKNCSMPASSSPTAKQ